MRCEVAAPARGLTRPLLAGAEGEEEREGGWVRVVMTRRLALEGKAEGRGGMGRLGLGTSSSRMGNVPGKRGGCWPVPKRPPSGPLSRSPKIPVPRRPASRPRPLLAELPVLAVLVKRGMAWLCEKDEEEEEEEAEEEAPPGWALGLAAPG